MRIKRNIPRTPLFMLNDMFTAYYHELRRAKKNGRPVAWATLGFPKNILYALNILPAYPQFHAAFQSNRRKARHILETVENRFEIPHDICGEVKSMVGVLLTKERLSFKLPPPDLMAAANAVCGAAVKGLRYLNRIYTVPFYFCDYPFVTEDSVPEHAVRYVDAQLKDVISRMESDFGLHFGEDAHDRYMENDFKALLVWREILKLMAGDPAPLNALDLYFFIMPFFLFRSEDDALVRMFLALYNETAQRLKKMKASKKAGANSGEIRILWDLLPVYHKMDYFKKKFAEYDAVVVMSTYLLGEMFYPDTMDPLISHPADMNQVERLYRDAASDDLEKFRRLSLEQDGNRPVSLRKKLIADMIRDFQIDGVVIHMDRTCRPMSLPQYELKRFITERMNIPVMLFDADSMDERYFSESQTTTRLEAFLENLRESRGGRKP